MSGGKCADRPIAGFARRNWRGEGRAVAPRQLKGNRVRNDLLALQQSLPIPAKKGKEMLVQEGRVAREAGESSFSGGANEVSWRGLVYREGLRAGAESLQELGNVGEDGIPEAASKLKGVYFAAVHNKKTRNSYAFVDPGGFHHAYQSGGRAGTSFLDLCFMEGCTPNDLDPEALVEFFHFGCLYGNKTFFPEMRNVDPESVIRSTPAGNIERLARPVPDIAEPPKRSLDRRLEDFARALAHEQVSVDMTGGIDSRLLAVALSYFGLPFETAASGRPGIADLEIAESVANTLGKPFHVTYHAAEQSDWDELVWRSSGMFDVTKNSRLMQLQKDRRARGINVSVSGAGGELFKDFWWLQDFPFYARRRPRLERLYSLRVSPQPLLHSLLADRPYRAISENYRSNALRELSRHAVRGNTQSYDRIYYYFKLRAFAGSFMTASLPVMPVAAPYLDPETAQVGYSLPRSRRFFNRFHSQTVARYSRQVARLPTTEGGMSCSAAPAAISLDLGRYVADRCKRLTKKGGERFPGKTFFQESPDDPKMPDELRAVAANRRTTEILADRGVLRTAIAPNDLPVRTLGPLFVLGRLVEELERPASGAAASAEGD
jgi:Asparagine synthase